MLLVNQYEIKKSSNIDVYNMLDNFCFPYNKGSES